MSNVNKGFQLFDTDGEPLEKRDIILKDVDGLLTDVVATEAKNGIYFAEVPLGSMWNVWDNTTPPGSDTGFILDAGSSRTREPAIPPGAVPTDVWTALKEFKPIGMATVTGLQAALEAEALARVSGLSAEAQARDNADKYLSGLVESVTLPHVVVEGSTYSKHPVSVRKVCLQSGAVDGAGFQQLAYTIPSSGDWVDFVLLNHRFPMEEWFGSAVPDIPWASPMVPGLIREFGVTLLDNENIGSPGSSLLATLDFGIRIARWPMGGALDPYSSWFMPTFQQHIVRSGYSCSHFRVVPSETVESVMGGFQILIRAKVKTIGVEVVIPEIHHGNVDICIFPKVA